MSSNDYKAMRRFEKREVFTKTMPTRMYVLWYRGHVVSTPAPMPIIKSIQKKLRASGGYSGVFEIKAVN